MNGLRANVVYVAILLATATFAGGDVVRYEGDVFPEAAGWSRVGTSDASRSILGGLFVQSVNGPGVQDFYQKSLSDFSGADAFFFEWRVETDAPSYLIDLSRTPVVFSAFGNAANYHVTITDARVRLNRSNFLPLVETAIDSALAHTYRLELQGDTSYRWLIDGQLVDTGVPTGRFTNSESLVIWGANFDQIENTTKWDYIRYGAVPEPSTAPFFIVGLIILGWTRGHRRKPR